MPQTVDEMIAEPEPNTFLNLNESFDYITLKNILNNKKGIKKQLRKSCFKNKYDPFLQAQKYLDKSYYGNISVSYIKKN